MPRQLELEYIQDEVNRQGRFSKRRDSLLRKAYEISVLCGVDVAFLAFSPSGSLNHFASHKRIEEVLARFISLPDEQREFPIENPQELLQLLSRLQQETERRTFATEQFTAIEEEIKQVKKQIEIGEAELRNYEPDPETVTTVEEAELREKFIQDALDRLMERKMELIQEQHSSLQTGQHSRTILDQQQLGSNTNYEVHTVSDASGGVIGGSMIVPSTDPTYQGNGMLIRRYESTTVVNHPSHQGNGLDDIGTLEIPIMVDTPSPRPHNTVELVSADEDLLVSHPATENLVAPNSENSRELEPHNTDDILDFDEEVDLVLTDEDLLFLHDIVDNFVDPDNQNHRENAGEIEPPISTSSLSASQIIDVLANPDTGLFPVELPGDVVPNVDFGEDSSLKNSNYDLPSLPEQLQPLDSFNFSSDPLSTQQLDQFGLGDELVSSSANPDQCDGYPQYQNQSEALNRDPQPLNDNQQQTFYQSVNQSEFCTPLWNTSQSVINPNSSFYTSSATFQNNFMSRGLSIMPPGAPINDYMGIMGSAMGQHGCGASLTLQPQMGTGIAPGYFMPQLQPQMGMSVPLQPQMGMAPGCGKRKLSTRDGNTFIGITDQVNPYPLQIGANQNPRLNHPNNNSEARYRAQNLNNLNPINPQVHNNNQAQNLNGFNSRPMINAPRLSLLAPAPSVYDPHYGGIGSHVDPYLRQWRPIPRAPRHNIGQVSYRGASSNPTDQLGMDGPHGRRTY